jgi:hypothetical protein
MKTPPFIANEEKVQRLAARLKREYDPSQYSELLIVYVEREDGKLIVLGYGPRHEVARQVTSALEKEPWLKEQALKERIVRGSKLLYLPNERRPGNV